MSITVAKSANVSEGSPRWASTVYGDNRRVCKPAVSSKGEE